MGIKKTINNFDLVRLILWVSSEKNENNIREFKSTTKLQKLVFIALHDDSDIKSLKEKKLYTDEPFEFVAKQFGPYSNDLNLLLVEMEQSGEITINKPAGDNKLRTYTFNKKVKDELQQIDKAILEEQSMKKLMGKILYYSKLNLEDLLAVVYRDPRYSKYLVNSKIAHRF